MDTSSARTQETAASSAIQDTCRATPRETHSETVAIQPAILHPDATDGISGIESNGQSNLPSSAPAPTRGDDPSPTLLDSAAQTSPELPSARDTMPSMASVASVASPASNTSPTAASRLPTADHTPFDATSFIDALQAARDAAMTSVAGRRAMVQVVVHFAIDGSARMETSFPPPAFNDRHQSSAQPPPSAADRATAFGAWAQGPPASLASGSHSRTSTAHVPLVPPPLPADIVPPATTYDSPLYFKRFQPSPTSPWADLLVDITSHACTVILRGANLRLGGKDGPRLCDAMGDRARGQPTSRSPPPRSSSRKGSPRYRHGASRPAPSPSPPDTPPPPPR